MPEVCKDGRIWGQNNKEAGGHLGILTGRKGYIKGSYIKKGWNPNSGINTRFKKGRKFFGKESGNWKV
jgi:hypothetical protein